MCACVRASARRDRGLRVELEIFLVGLVSVSQSVLSTPPKGLRCEQGGAGVLVLRPPCVLLLDQHAAAIGPTARQG